MILDTLILLPGMDGTGTLFDNLIAEFPSELAVTVVRYPTHRFLGYPELIPFVEEAVPKSGRYLLVAESFSTPLAAQFAATRPPNLAGLVLCAGFVSSPIGAWSQLVRLLASTPLFRISPPSWILRHLLIGTSPPSALEAGVRETLRLVGPGVLAGRVRAVLDCDAREDLNRIKIPMMYIQAGGDRLVRADCFREIQKLRPDTVLTSIPGPHLLLQREPRKAAEAIVRFIRQLPK